MLTISFGAIVTELYKLKRGLVLGKEKEVRAFCNSSHHLFVDYFPITTHPSDDLKSKPHISNLLQYKRRNINARKVISLY